MRALWFVFVLACAQGGAANMQQIGDDQPIDAAHHDDAPVSHLDAPVCHFDASPPIDAAVDAPVPPDGAIFCSDNTQCTDPGTCCFVTFCVAGSGLGSNLCFPS